MRILFTFENPPPSMEADAEVFLTTAKHLATFTTDAWLHIPVMAGRKAAAVDSGFGLPIIRAFAPIRPAVLRHFFCGLTLVLRRKFRQADLVYTRNLWIAWISVTFGRRVVFDHYRPWPDQIPPLQRWLYRLLCHPRFIVHICHSNYTRQKYAGLGVPEDKLRCVHNGFDPRRLSAAVDIATAKRRLGIDPRTKTVVYTGRVNQRKGLELVLEAAGRLPEVLFILVGSYGDGPIERLAEPLTNVRIVGWQAPETMARYIFAADILLIPPSMSPLAQFGTTVLPLKLFMYMASGRAIIAGDTPDVREILQHGRNAFLCHPDCSNALVTGIRALTTDPPLSARLAATALDDSRGLTWASRAEKIAQIVREQIESAPAPGRWGHDQQRRWREESRRWLAHLIRKRSWILPSNLADPQPQRAD